MFNKPKYVVFTLADGIERSIMIDPIQNHSQATRNIAISLTDTWDFSSVSAGFVSFGGGRDDEGNIELRIDTYGHSSSLKSVEQPFQSRESDSALFLAAVAGEGLFFTVIDNGMIESCTVLGPEFSKEEIATIFKDQRVLSQGYLKIKLNEDYDAVVDAIQHTIEPDKDFAPNEDKYIKSFLGASGW